MTRNDRRMITAVLPVIIALIFLSSSPLSAMSPKPRIKPFPNLWSVLRVIDGETIVVRYFDQMERVRLLKVNTPGEGLYGYEQALEVMKNLAGSNKVFLEFEPSGGEKRDKNGCLLAYVFYNGRNINVEMVRSGWSKFWPEFGDGKYAAEFRQAQQEAEEAKKGLWKRN